MTLVINQFLDQQSLEDESHAQAPFGVVDEIMCGHHLKKIQGLTSSFIVEAQ
jgi:hypothetical protein